MMKESFELKEAKPEMTVFGRPDCRYCDLALTLLLDVCEVSVDYRDVTYSAELEALKTLLPDVKLIPQIFQNDEDGRPIYHIGGYSDLMRMYSSMSSE